MPIVVHKYDAPLLEAIMQGNLDATKSILQTEGGALLFHEKNSAGDTALHLACKYGRLNFVKFILRGAGDDDAFRSRLNNIQNQRGQVPLHYAAMYGMENIVEFIVKDLLDDDEDFGDPRQVCDYRGKAPIDVAHENGHSQTCAILRDPRKAKEDAAIREAAEVRAMANKNLLFAAANGDSAWVSELLDAGGAELNFRDTDGNTALIIAASNQKAHTARLLIQRGACPTTESNRFGRTAQHYDTGLFWFQAQHQEKLRKAEEEEKRQRGFRL